jgi:hypothetical protein
MSDIVPLDHFVLSRYSWDFDICPWGSCQYQTAYYTHRALADEFKTADEAIETFAAGTLGARADFSLQFIADMRDHYSDPVFDDVRPEIAAHYTPSEAMQFMRIHAWDLWSAAPQVLRALYPDHDLVAVCEEDDTNYWTGFVVFILERQGHIEISDVEGFDT